MEKTGWTTVAPPIAGPAGIPSGRWMMAVPSGPIRPACAPPRSCQPAAGCCWLRSSHCKPYPAPAAGAAQGRQCARAMR